MRSNSTAEAKGWKWSGGRDLNSGPPAPKLAGLSFLSPSFATLFLKTKEAQGPPKPRKGDGGLKNTPEDWGKLEPDLGCADVAAVSSTCLVASSP
jgi:hypothetical protein